VNTGEVADFDSYTASKSPSAVFEKLEERANEPYVLAGEDVGALKLTTLSVFKRLGDSGTERALQNATGSQRSAVSLFVKPDYPDSWYPKTRAILGPRISLTGRIPRSSPSPFKIQNSKFKIAPASC